MKPQEFDKIKKEKRHLISEAERDENGRLIRYVDGKKIYQSEEKTEADRRFNEACNLWRMRNVKAYPKVGIYNTNFQIRTND